MKKAICRHPGAGPRDRLQGFSLVQLMITVAIVAILTGIAIPSYKYVTTSNRIANEINGLLGDLQYARFAAIKAGQTVTVCASSNPTVASPTCSVSTNWATGWIVFSDTTGTGQFVAGEGKLRDQQPLVGGDTLVGTISGISFNREGFPVTTTTAPNNANVTIKLRDPTNNAQFERCIQVGFNGQVLTEKNGTGGCT
ncbi:MAG: GspH/FimT family pseudopilin [Steroidobacterales bacterium]